MSSSHTDKRIDPLVDAYRQASELEAQSSGAQPSAALRAAVLAHARVVAQSATTAEPKLAVSEAVRATPAANESRPIWRIAAGVMLGLAGMWIYQLTRPGTTGEANVAVLSAPKSASSAPSVSAESTAVTGAPATTAAAAPVSSSTVAIKPAQPETTVAVAALSRPAVTATPATAARDTSALGRSTASSNSAGASGPRERLADAARSDTTVALAKADAPTMRSEPSAPVPTQSAVAVAPATSAIPEIATAEPFGETIVASAEMRKATRSSAAARPPAVAAPAPMAASPSAFPATASGATMAAAPPPAEAVAAGAARAPAASPLSTFAGEIGAVRQGGGGATPEAALFSAVRSGNVNAFRAALARGANVNARDEAGRSALQIARQRNDLEMMKALDSAGAK